MNTWVQGFSGFVMQQGFESGCIPCRINWKSKKKKKKKGKDNRLDLYALLGLQNERWTATDAQIKLGEPS